MIKERVLPRKNTWNLWLITAGLIGFKVRTQKVGHSGAGQLAQTNGAGTLLPGLFGNSWKLLGVKSRGVLQPNLNTRAGRDHPWEQYESGFPEEPEARYTPQGGEGDHT